MEPLVVVVGGLVAFGRSSHGWVTSPWSPRTPSLPCHPPVQVTQNCSFGALAAGLYPWSPWFLNQGHPHLVHYNS